MDYEIKDTEFTPSFEEVEVTAQDLDFDSGAVADLDPNLFPEAVACDVEFEDTPSVTPDERAIELSNKIENAILSAVAGNPECLRDTSILTKLGLDNQYEVACQTNPALPWYFKLYALLPQNSLFVNDNGLNLQVTEDNFNKFIKPFLGQFKESLIEYSPLVGLVHDVAKDIASCHVKSVSNSQLDDVKAQKMQNFADHSNDFDPTSCDFDSVQDAEALDNKIADMFLDTDLMGNEEVRVASDEEDDKSPSLLDKLEFNVSDFSSKYLAEFIVKNHADEEEAREALQTAGLSESRINEVLAISKYLSLDKALLKAPKRTDNSLLEEFLYEV